MTRPRTLLGVLAASLTLTAVPASAASDATIIPPGNPAANQYTEAIPTSRGNKDTESHSRRSPKEALGSKNAKKLEGQGADGRATAELAAETAPATATERGEKSSDGSGQKATTDEGGAAGASGGNGGSGGGGTPNGSGGEPAAKQTASSDGSSGLGEVVSQATGSDSSGDLGLLLPLMIVLVLAGSVAYAIRQRRAVNR